MATRPALALVALVAVAAADPPDDLVRRANTAFLQGQPDAADALYAAAAERAADPGLVAFNRAAVLVRRGEFKEAEGYYARVLDDADCPPARAARAWFDRGTCVLKRGTTAAAFRAAATHFERCLDLRPADEGLVADARHNLELAKLLWAEANAKAAKPDTPNAPQPDDPADPPPPPTGGGDQDLAPEPGDGGPSGPGGDRPGTPGKVAAKDGPPDAGKTTAGNNSGLPVVRDDDPADVRSPDEARDRLRRAADRTRGERQRLLRALAGPDRPGVLDW